MRLQAVAGALAGLAIFGPQASLAQQNSAVAAAQDVIPDKMPFDIPYGPAITLAQARTVIGAAVAECQKHSWKMNVAVVDSGGNLVAFERMDDAQIASVEIAQHKARVAAQFRRETKVFETNVLNGVVSQLSLDDVIASRGGVPLVQNGKLIGAIGASGGAGAQDEVCSKAGASVIK